MTPRFAPCLTEGPVTDACSANSDGNLTLVTEKLPVVAASAIDRTVCPSG